MYTSQSALVCTAPWPQSKEVQAQWKAGRMPITGLTESLELENRHTL